MDEERNFTIEPEDEPPAQSEYTQPDYIPEWTQPTQPEEPEEPKKKRRTWLKITALLLALLIRALTRNAALAWGVGGVCALAALAVYLIDAAKLEGLLPTLMEKLSLFERFYPFVNGIFDWTSVVFYGSVIVFFLFLTVMSLEKRRYN